nr:hypothetical protein [uncultured Vibrio sp.]
MFYDLGFYSSLLGLLGLIITTGWRFWLERRLRSVESTEKSKLAGASSEDEPTLKLEITDRINKAKKDCDEYSKKMSNQVFLILLGSFALSVGDIILSNNNGNKVEDRLTRIENYLWPPVGGGGGGEGASLAEQVSAMTTAISRIEGLQLKIIDTIYKEKIQTSQYTTQKMKELTREIEMLNMRISILKRQQGGQSEQATHNAE